MPKKAAPLNPDPNPVTIDIDAMLSEQIAGSNTTTLRFALLAESNVSVSRPQSQTGAIRITAAALPDHQLHHPLKS